MSIRSLVVLGGVVIAVSASAAPAVAADELGLSRDGKNWSSTIGGPLIGGPVRWVPGDSSTARFYVRNQAGDVGDLTVDVTGTRAGSLLDSGDIHIAARGGGGPWTSVNQGGTHRLVTSPRIPAGETRAVDVRVSLDPAATNGSQFLSADLYFRVTLTDASIMDGPTPGSVVGGPTPVVDGRASVGDELAAGGGKLPGTGSPELGWFAGFGAILVGIGLALTRRRQVVEGVEHV